MPQTIRSPRRLAGTLAVPGDKSVSHRALILNAIAEGNATVSGLSDGADVQSTAACLRQMGVSIDPLDADPLDADAPGSFRIASPDGPALREPADLLDAGNSGTSMRLLSGLLAGQDFLSVITGDASLRSRPMGRIVQPLQQMGAAIMGRRGDTLAPLAIPRRQPAPPGIHPARRQRAGQILPDAGRTRRPRPNYPPPARPLPRPHRANDDRYGRPRGHRRPHPNPAPRPPPRR